MELAIETKKKFKSPQSAPEAFLYNIFEKLGWIDEFNIKTQYTIDNYRVDFYFEKINLIVEIDSKTHQIQEDLKRDLDLLKKGFKIYRIDWEDFKRNPEYEFQNFAKYVYFLNEKFRWVAPKFKK